MSFKLCFLNKGQFSLSPIKSKIDLDELLGPKTEKKKKKSKKNTENDEEIDIYNDLSQLISIHPKKDKYMNQKDSEESDDDIIKKNDNLIISLNTAEFPTLDIYIYNHTDNDFYLHHQVILNENSTNFDWIDFDPIENSNGNIACVVTQEMNIQLWDLDIFDPLEPFFDFKINKSSSKKVKNKKFHEELVTSLKWNSNCRNLLVTGSMDKKILIWDLNKDGKCIRGFLPKTGCIREVLWHPTEPEPLLVLGDKKRVVLLDCRDKNTNLRFDIKSKGESLTWNMFENFEFFVGCESGDVVSFDIRKQEPLFSFKAHNDSVSELINLNGFKDSMVTCCDEILKIWKISQPEPVCLARKKFKENICSISRCMDENGIFCCGLLNGDVKVINLSEFPDALKQFN